MRRKTGQVAISLNLIIAIFVVGSLGLVAYECARILLARDQLKHCLELASLAAASELASTSATGSNAQTMAETVGLNILRMNSILGQPLTNGVTQATSISALQPNVGQVAVYFEFDDPITKQPVGANQQAGVVRAYGAYNYSLFSGGFGSIGVSTYVLMADALAGAPAVDLVIVYSNSGSNDDQTPVTFVRRYWDPGAPGGGAISYFIPPGEQGQIGSVVCAPVIGSQVNGLPPQNLDGAGDPKVSKCPKEWSEVGTLGTTVPLRGVLNSNDPPGDAPQSLGGVGLANMTVGPGNNPPPGQVDDIALKMPSSGRQHTKLWWLQWLAAKCSKLHLEQPAEAHYSAPAYDHGSASYNPWNADPTMFTDVVVNLDGNIVFNGYNPPPGPFQGYRFPSIDFLVEASRGNMENGNVSPNAYTNATIGGAVQPGYQQAYQCLAYAQLQPKGTLETDIKGFMAKLAQTSDCHFGFVAFNNRAGLNPLDSDKAPAISWAYPVAGTVNYAIPQIPLNTGSNNIAAINNVLTPPTSIPNQGLFVPNGGSNLADGLTQAYNQLTSNQSRTGALKAILVVTDKVPTRDLAGNVYPNPAANGPALQDAITVATNCKTQGFPIFVIGLDQSGQMAPYMTTQFSDTQAGGLVQTAGSGGTLLIANWTNAAQAATTLEGDFNNVIRQLLTLMRG